MSAEDIRQSVDEYRREIAKAQIVMFPGGFSAGDEPEALPSSLPLYSAMQ